jgi:methylmalonyl-CoA/ethylmalonyl-CoA epimerase|tara:strand:- start:2410 stop:2892 length:483 start_codon:yes stop_codon:yes gene_type:complete
MIDTKDSNIVGIKHMAFAVENIETVLRSYKNFLGVSKSIQIMDMPKSRTRVAVFEIGNIEYQLCQSQDSDGRFSKWIKERGQGGLHHICYIVKNLDAALDNQKKNGAKLRECQACKVIGNHPHPEGFIAFLDNEVEGVEIELMQIYTTEELEKYSAYKGI